MITYRRGNIFESEAKALINPVNCVGVSGKGLALEFKKRFPNYHRDYRSCCALGTLKPGRVIVHPALIDCYIISFPTKNHWKRPSQLEWIILGMDSLVRAVKKLPIQSIAIPKLGCGNGGLQWKDVKPIIEEAAKRMKGVDVEVWI